MKYAALVIALGLIAVACGDKGDSTPEVDIPREKTVMLEVTGMT